MTTLRSLALLLALTLFAAEARAQPSGLVGALGGDTVDQRLMARYATSAGYQAVERAVRRFYPPFRRNGCVAFMSEALRQAGVKVPHGPASLVTRDFSRHLQGVLRWTRVTSLGELRPGDVCFTQDDPSWPGFPAHTFMFVKWKDRARNLADVVDNQGFTHTRNLTLNDHANFNFTPFAYALRAPQ
jgi:hypothetical protein